MPDVEYFVKKFLIEKVTEKLQKMENFVSIFSYYFNILFSKILTNITSTENNLLATLGKSVISQ